VKFIQEFEGRQIQKILGSIFVSWSKDTNIPIELLEYNAHSLYQGSVNCTDVICVDLYKCSSE